MKKDEIKIIKDKETGNILINHKDWGHWWFDVSALYFSFLDDNFNELYAGDILRGRNTVDSASFLDWIVQAGLKPWITSKDTKGLIRMFNDLFDLQKNFCSYGKNKELTIEEVVEILNKKLESFLNE